MHRAGYTYWEAGRHIYRDIPTHHGTRRGYPASPPSPLFSGLKEEF